VRGRTSVFVPSFILAPAHLVTISNSFVAIYDLMRQNASESDARGEKMSRSIFVNLPVEDLEKSKRFYEALGARNEPKFSNEAAAMMVLSDTIHVIILSKHFYARFTS
jgi:hypothetical protein